MVMNGSKHLEEEVVAEEEGAVVEGEEDAGVVVGEADDDHHIWLIGSLAFIGINKPISCRIMILV